jgi:hypothetical protein
MVGAGAGESGSGVSVGALVGGDVGAIAVGVAGGGAGDGSDAAGDGVCAGAVLVGGTSVAGSGMLFAGCVGVTVSRGSGVRGGRWRAVGYGLAAACEVAVGGVAGRSVVGAGVPVTAGVSRIFLLCANGATTRTVTWSLLEGALSALSCTWFTQLPRAVAVNVTCIAPPVPGATTPIARVKPDGVKHPPVTTSVSVTPVAGTVPLLP